MIEFWNVVIASVAGGIIGAAIHSAWLHSKQRGEFRIRPEDILMVLH